MSENLPEIKSNVFLEIMLKRRSVREFSTEPVSAKLIENIIQIGATAPSGANKQPWKFCAVTSRILKSKIREEAEKVERINYEERFTELWKKDLAFLGTNYNKPFLEQAPVLIAVFKEKYVKSEDGALEKNYYVNESCGIALGFMIAAIHHSGLSTLVYTPSPMNFLNTLLSRPENETPIAILPVGYPKQSYQPPKKTTKELNDVLIWF